MNPTEERIQIVCKNIQQWEEEIEDYWKEYREWLRNGTAMTLSNSILDNNKLIDQALNELDYLEGR